VYRYIVVEIYRRLRATNYRQVKAQSVMYRYTHPYWDRSVPQWALTDFYSKAGFFNKVDEKHAGASSMANRAIYPITVRDTSGRWINKKAIYKLSQRFIRVIPLINSRYCRRAAPLRTAPLRAAPRRAAPRVFITRPFTRRRNCAAPASMIVILLHATNRNSNLVAE